ncbi:hypothetical protein EMIT036CA2_60086 [Chryseobacterium sp. IT-36CA2]
MYAQFSLIELYKNLNRLYIILHKWQEEKFEREKRKPLKIKNIPKYIKVILTHLFLYIWLVINPFFKIDDLIKYILIFLNHNFYFLSISNLIKSFSL